MVVNDHPGCCGVAARLPKSPGIQKLTPPSSAAAGFGTNATAQQVNRIPIDVRTDIATPNVGLIWLAEAAIRTTQTRHIRARIPQRAKLTAARVNRKFNSTEQYGIYTTRSGIQMRLTLSSASEW